MPKIQDVFRQHCHDRDKWFLIFCFSFSLYFILFYVLHFKKHILMISWYLHMTIKWAGLWVAHSANCCDIDQGVTLQGEGTILKCWINFLLTPLQSAVLRLRSAHKKFKVTMHTSTQEQWPRWALAGGIKCWGFLVWLQCKLMTFLNKEWPVYAIINNMRLCVKNNFVIKLHIYQENCTNYAKA